jgi:phosphoribosylformylglycinamidine synthase subunit PurS
MYKAIITVTLRPSILDPEGKAIEHAMHALGLHGASQVRVGKHIALHVDAPDETAARLVVDEACKKLLSNPVMEDYLFSLESVENT